MHLPATGVRCQINTHAQLSYWLRLPLALHLVDIVNLYKSYIFTVYAVYCKCYFLRDKHRLQMFLDEKCMLTKWRADVFWWVEPVSVILEVTADWGAAPSPGDTCFCIIRWQIKKIKDMQLIPSAELVFSSSSLQLNEARRSWDSAQCYRAAQTGLHRNSGFSQRRAENERPDQGLIQMWTVRPFLMWSS